MTQIQPVTGGEEVCRFAAELIRVDTTNHGGGNAVGERAAADLVEGWLAEVGVTTQRYERAPGRTNLIARWSGTDPTLPVLLLHGHLDVVPADPAEWSVDPFGGVIRDGMLWGRGAVDMKNMVAMIVAAVRSLAATGVRPRRDIVLGFFADEEDNSHFGARWLIADHPEVFAGVDVAVSEVGGFSTTVNGRRTFLVQTGEKGILWLRLVASGRAGHASQINDHNPVAILARAVARIADERWPITLTDTTARLYTELLAITGMPAGTDASHVFAATGCCAPFVLPGLSTVANVTMLRAGNKVNVVPGEATAHLDVRVLPGDRDRALARIRELVGAEVEVIVDDDVAAVETTFDGPIIDAIRASITHHAPDAEIVPYLLPAGTDNAILAPLGIRGFGFVPLLLPDDFDFPAMFHGIDERVPVDALVFGHAVLTHLLQTY